MSMQQRTRATIKPHSSYGCRTFAGAIAVRFLAIIAVGIVVMGLLNRPGGDFASSVDMTPHTTATATVSR